LGDDGQREGLIFLGRTYFCPSASTGGLDLRRPDVGHGLVDAGGGEECGLAGIAQSSSLRHLELEATRTLKFSRASVRFVYVYTGILSFVKQTNKQTNKQTKNSADA